MYRTVLRWFGAAEIPAAWILLIGGIITLIGVITGLIVTGTAKWATLLVAADLVVSGFSAVQQSDDDVENAEGSHRESPR